MKLRILPPVVLVVTCCCVLEASAARIPAGAPVGSRNPIRASYSFSHRIGDNPSVPAVGRVIETRPAPAVSRGAAKVGPKVSREPTRIGHWNPVAGIRRTPSPYVVPKIQTAAVTPTPSTTSAIPAYSPEMTKADTDVVVVVVGGGGADEVIPELTTQQTTISDVSLADDLHETQTPIPSSTPLPIFTVPEDSIAPVTQTSPQPERVYYEYHNNEEQYEAKEDIEATLREREELVKEQELVRGPEDAVIFEYKPVSPTGFRQIEYSYRTIVGGR